MVVRGLVQGVGFRWACVRAAERLGVAGRVRNLPSGEVEIVVEGEPDDVDRLVAWARRGPAEARVDQVEVTDEPPEGLAGFRVAG